MKRLVFTLLCIPFFGIAQDYQLDFNSTNISYVEIPNASYTIAYNTEFTISGWVKPQIDASHSGLFGFRNNTDADFFLLQLQNTNNVEARFRNSAGVQFDIVAYNILDIGQWQHLAFSYDGSFIRLYKNGSLIDSASANGTITNVNESFKIGALDWQTTSFPMEGNVDEVRLWNAALSESVISNWMCTAIDLTHPNYNNLMGYWRLDDGTGNVISDNSPNNLNGTLVNTNWSYSTSCFLSSLLTYVPDDNFEQYLISWGYDNVLDDYVITANIDTMMYLHAGYFNIADLTGIEDFISLVWLDVNFGTLTTLDVSNNTNLEWLLCEGHQLTSLDVSNNTSLKGLYCGMNELTSLDLTNNVDLRFFSCSYNQLTSLDLRNGSDSIYQPANLYTNGNPNLTCINVDDPALASYIWTVANGSIDPQHYFSNNCGATSIEGYSSNKKLLKITNILGREVNEKQNILLFYIYDDGTVEKKLFIK